MGLNYNAFLINLVTFYKIYEIKATIRNCKSAKQAALARIVCARAAEAGAEFPRERSPF